jgi:hypothetical protein
MIQNIVIQNTVIQNMMYSSADFNTANIKHCVLYRTGHVDPVGPSLTQFRNHIIKLQLSYLGFMAQPLSQAVQHNRAVLTTQTQKG